jgi:hypothetical protein
MTMSSSSGTLVAVPRTAYWLVMPSNCAIRLRSSAGSRGLMSIRAADGRDVEVLGDRVVVAELLVLVEGDPPVDGDRLDRRQLVGLRAGDVVGVVAAEVDVDVAARTAAGFTVAEGCVVWGS